MVLNDIIFVCETLLSLTGLPDIKGYKAYADKNYDCSKSRGLAFYIKTNLAPEVTNVTFNQFYISFQLKTAPSYIFFGIYFQHSESRNFIPTQFNLVGNHLKKHTDAKRKVIAGGDFNSRVGDINTFSSQIYGFNYNFLIKCEA